jgi:hypothetical protein
MSAVRRLILLLGSTVLVGCAGLQRVPPDQVEQRGGDETADADEIEIQVSSSPGIPGPADGVKWVLRRNGECRGTATHSTGDTAVPPTRVEMELQSEQAYRACERLLRETRFFQMREPEWRLRFESGGTSITVRVGRRRHGVAIAYSDRPPEGFTRVEEFVKRLTKDARQVEPAP